MKGRDKLENEIDTEKGEREALMAGNKSRALNLIRISRRTNGDK